MKTPKVFIVHLRRPVLTDPNERRSDPFFEVGSFGSTGCHSSNLMRVKHAAELQGARLAFAQGGDLGFRLVFLTPPVQIRVWRDHLEARWTPMEMPLRYSKASVLVANDFKSDFPFIEALAWDAVRETIEGGFSSRFRTRAKPLEEAAASQLIEVYTKFRREARPVAISETYDDALPYRPPLVDVGRRKT